MLYKTILYQRQWGTICTTIYGTIQYCTIHQTVVFSNTVLYDTLPIQQYITILYDILQYNNTVQCDTLFYFSKYEMIHYNRVTCYPIWFIVTIGKLSWAETGLFES